MCLARAGSQGPRPEGDAPHLPCWPTRVSALGSFQNPSPMFGVEEDLPLEVTPPRLNVYILELRDVS